MVTKRWQNSWIKLTKYNYTFGGFNYEFIRNTQINFNNRQRGHYWRLRLNNHKLSTYQLAQKL